MTARPELLIATTNPGKIAELTEFFSGLVPRLRSLSEFAATPEAEETGTTFERNAVIKALHYSSHTGLWALADDSGLEVEALGGAPGVFSARYGGSSASYPERMARLLAEVAQTGDAARRARFVCVIALAAPGDERVRTFKGECRGRIAHAPRGSNGFGYDPVFIPDGHAQTFGELPADAKRNLSHRARAAAQVRDHIRGELSETDLTRS